MDGLPLELLLQLDDVLWELSCTCRAFRPLWIEDRRSRDPDFGFQLASYGSWQLLGQLFDRYGVENDYNVAIFYELFNADQYDLISRLPLTGAVLATDRLRAILNAAGVDRQHRLTYLFKMDVAIPFQFIATIITWNWARPVILALPLGTLTTYSTTILEYAIRDEQASLITELMNRVDIDPHRDEMRAAFAVFDNLTMYEPFFKHPRFDIKKFGYYFFRRLSNYTYYITQVAKIPELLARYCEWVLYRGNLVVLTHTELKFETANVTWKLTELEARADLINQAIALAIKTHPTFPRKWLDSALHPRLTATLL